MDTTTRKIDPALDRLLDAMLGHVPFEGWSPASFRAAAEDADLTESQARSLAPRGALDLAVQHHKRGDAAMIESVRKADLSNLRYRDRVAFAIRTRLEAIPDRESARRAAALFSLPHLAPEGAKLIWGTADAIWTALGDSSNDVNWYTKRMTLSGVYSSCLLFWLGDDSSGGQATEAFIDRRIDEVMQIEKVKAQVRENPILGPVARGAEAMTSWIKPPPKMPDIDMPGSWTTRS